MGTEHSCCFKTTGFSILLSSMYQYLEDEAGKSAKAFQGYLVGAFR